MDDPWEVPDTIRRAAGMSTRVTIDHAAPGSFARTLLERGLGVPPWDPRYHYHDGTERTVAYLMVLDALNFCFWPPEGEDTWQITFRDERLSGYVALAASLTRAVESGVPIDSARYLATLTMEALDEILAGTGCLQLKARRLINIHELGRALLSRFDGKAHRLVERARGSAVRLVRLLAEHLPSFRDTARYRGMEVGFYKRAQILAADLHGAFGGRMWGAFDDMHRLTAFADYKLPQVLRHLGIIRYAPELARTVDHQTLISAGSEEEVEIRAATVVAVEMIREALARLGHPRCAHQIDWLLWNMGQDDTYRKKPYHRTVTMCY